MENKGNVIAALKKFSLVGRKKLSSVIALCYWLISLIICIHSCIQKIFIECLLYTRHFTGYTVVSGTRCGLFHEFHNLVR